MSSTTWDAGGGVLAEIEDVARWIDDTGREYLTLSGGEPFDQALALAHLVDTVRGQRSLLVTAYSGYTRELLERDILPGSRDLLGRLDLLIDGRYRRDLHDSLLWRGSSNQRIHNLSGRIEVPPDEPAGLQVTVDGQSFVVVGVPDEPAWMERFEGALPDGFATVSTGPPDKSSFPFPVVEVP